MCSDDVKCVTMGLFSFSLYGMAIRNSRRIYGGSGEMLESIEFIFIFAV